MRLLISHARLITQDPKLGVIDDGALLIDGDEIKAIGSSSELIEAHLKPGVEHLDVQGKVVMPGLINCHTHIYSAFARGMAVSRPTRNFVEVLENLWWLVDKQLSTRDCTLSAYATISESIKMGVTTIIDHHASPNAVRDSLFAIDEAADKLGVRRSLAYEVSDRDGEQVVRDGIDENIAYMKAVNHLDNGMQNGLFGLHAAFTLSDQTLDMCANAIADVKGGYHVHVAEGLPDETLSLERHGMRVVQRLDNFGVVSPESLMIHCVHLDDDEMNIIKEHNSVVVHNPMSNMNNGVGVTPVKRILDHQIPVGLGTDAYNNDMFESLKVAKILMSHLAGEPGVGFMEAVRAQFETNAHIASTLFNRELGVLRPGAQADLIVMDYHPYTMLNSDNWAGHAVFGMQGSLVTDTMIAGSWVMQNRQVKGLDEDRIFSEISERAQLCWKAL